jgi:protein-L-isoaspartate(D-aspartate) O-methyltransferase
MNDDRQAMVNLIASRDVTDKAVLDALRVVPRHRFVPAPLAGQAYDDRPLPIGEHQTISQPYIVGLMTQLLDPKPGDTVLEIGTGSGYQAAVLAELVAHVYSIEIIDVLSRRADSTLRELGYKNITVKTGDGYQGWALHAPFDGIIVTAAPDHVPQPLLDQLADGGHLVIPVGDEWQELIVLTRSGDEIEQRSVTPVRFVPMTGEAEEH